MLGTRVTLVVALLTPAAIGLAPSKPRPQVVADLLSEDPRVRKQAEKQIIEDRTQTVLALERLIQESLRGDYASEVMSELGKGWPLPAKYLATASAMNILGELRSAHSVPLLVSHLRFSITQGPVRYRLPALRDFPAATALVKIGLPSVRAVLERYKTDHRVWPLLPWWIVEGVLGEYRAKRWIKNAIVVESDPTKKGRLRKLRPPGQL